ncbi:hypothetical protein MTO96_005343 [Rhipicephalus appendiculatus]
MAAAAVELALAPGLTVEEDHRASAEESADLDRGPMLAREVPVVALVVLDPGPTPEVVDSVEVPDRGRALDRAVATEAALIHGLEQGTPVGLVVLVKPLEEELVSDPGTKPEELAAAKLAAAAAVRPGLRTVASGLVEKEVDGTSLRDPSSAEVSEVLVEKVLAGTFHRDRNFLVALIPGIKVA